MELGDVMIGDSETCGDGAFCGHDGTHALVILVRTHNKQSWP